MGSCYAEIMYKKRLFAFEPALLQPSRSTIRTTIIRMRMQGAAPTYVEIIKAKTTPHGEK